MPDATNANRPGFFVDAIQAVNREHNPEPTHPDPTPQFNPYNDRMEIRLTYNRQILERGIMVDGPLRGPDALRAVMDYISREIQERLHAANQRQNFRPLRPTHPTFDWANLEQAVRTEIIRDVGLAQPYNPNSLNDWYAWNGLNPVPRVPDPPPSVTHPPVVTDPWDSDFIKESVDTTATQG